MMSSMGTMSGMLMMFVMMSRTMRGTFTSRRIVLQTKNFLMMVMRQNRCRQHHYADYH